MDAGSGSYDLERSEASSAVRIPRDPHAPHATGLAHYEVTAR
jgi:hypothetical protein